MPSKILLTKIQPFSMKAIGALAFSVYLFWSFLPLAIVSEWVWTLGTIF